MTAFGPWVLVDGLYFDSKPDEVRDVRTTAQRFADDLAARGIASHVNMHAIGKDPHVGHKVYLFRGVGLLVTVYVGPRDVRRNRFAVRSALLPLRGEVPGENVVETTAQLVAHACAYTLAAGWALANRRSTNPPK